METTQNNKRPILILLSIVAAAMLVTSACVAGFAAGWLLPLPGRGSLPEWISDQSDIPTLQPEFAQESTPIQGASPEDLEKLFVPFWQAWQLVHEQYVDQPVDDQTLMRGAIRGMLDSLGDPHTAYLDPEEHKIITTQLQGEDQYEGIGAWVDTTADYLTIISPMPGSPAEKAGLRARDKILAVDGEDMTGIDGEAVRKKVIGPAGSTVNLTILRADQEPFDVDVQRAKITVPTLSYRMLDEDIAYVQLFIFGDDSKEQLRAALKTLLRENPKGLILDLRNNGGGYLEAAVDVASEFIGKGVILYEEYGDKSRRTFEARKGGLALDIPMVVLINEGSASASEIVAGAIQDSQRGKLVGAVSFGKGTVQIPTELKDEAGGVRITVARWLTPDERTIHGIGLTPDVEVAITQEDIEASIDLQLNKAIELLSQ